MTTEYKLLLNDTCTFTPLEQKKGEDVKRFEITIVNPKNLTAYETWNESTPQANAGTGKVFGISPNLFSKSNVNYDGRVKEVRGFTYKPTAAVVLGSFSSSGVPDNSGGLLVIDDIGFTFVKETNEPVMVIMAHAGHTPVLDDLFPFPTEPFNGKIRMNINSFQSTSMLGVVENEFIEGWLKPTYDKLEPFPYVGDEELITPEPQTGNRQRPTFNFAYGDIVSITSGSNGRSNISIKNPKQTLAYEVWNPLTPFSNRKLLQSAAIITLTDVYTIFKDSEKRANDKNLPLDQYAWRPRSSFDLVDETGKSTTYIGTITNMTSQFGEPNEAPTIILEVDTNNFEVYKNKRLPALPKGNFYMAVDIDGLWGDIKGPGEPLLDGLGDLV